MPSQSRRTALKDRPALAGVRMLLARFTPLGAMLDDPIRQSAFEAYVVTGLFGLDPFVTQNLFPFRLKLAIKRGVL